MRPKYIDMDNFHKGCPALMSDGRLFTDYRPVNKREQYIKSINGIVREDDYRMFLQNKGKEIMNREWNYHVENTKCTANVCIHTYPTRTPPGSLHEEMALYNAVRSGKTNKIPVCRSLEDYRLCYDNRR